MLKKMKFYYSDDVRELPSFKAFLLDLKNATEKDLIELSIRYSLFLEIDKENNRYVFKRNLGSTGLNEIKFNYEDGLGLFLLESEVSHFEDIKSIIESKDKELIEITLSLCKNRYEECVGEFSDSLRKIYLKYVIKYIKDEMRKSTCISQ